MQVDRSPRDPYRDAPVGELADPLLPRWFVLLAVVMVPVALGVIIVALLAGGSAEVPLAARRPPPPPGGELTSDVGDYAVGDAEAQPYETACALVRGVRIAGGERDLAALRRALASLCNVDLPAEVAEAVRGFATAGGLVRFAVFELTAVDSTAVVAEPPVLLVNAKFSQTDPLWIAPLIAHDATLLAGRAGAAEAALAARRAEAEACAAVLAGRRQSRGCTDAAALAAAPDALSQLRAAGWD